MSKKSSRRQFLKDSSLIAAGATVASGLTISQSAHAQGSDQMKVAMIGLGGRGGGAIRQRAQVGDNCKIVAVADVFERKSRDVAGGLRKEAEDAGNPLHDRVDLPNDRVFGGFDAYKKAIACLAPGDMAVIATPPGFRPYHYRAAIEKGCHVFMEKPIFVDAPGFRHVMETNKMAEEKGLKVCVGLQRRYEPKYSNWMNQIHAGTIGDLQYTRVFWNGGTPWTNRRNAGEDELRYQLRNWYHFVWLCGDNICEQHVHNLDIGNWIHGKGDRMAHPREANAQGGRTHKAGPDDIMRQAPPFADRKAWDEWYQKNQGVFNRHGQAWDHFFVEYTYNDESKMYSQCRHIPNTWGIINEYVYGTKGYGEPGWLNGLDRKQVWRNTENAPDPYEWEHVKLVEAIRKDLPMHDGYSAAMSCMSAVLGREAAYSGQVVKWDDLVEKGRPYCPNGEITSFDDVAPVQPDADGFYESTVPVPGMYNPFI
ncbi:MAG: Gfo/Idh/MocA family oxidoreductase [Planctomycetaceae bacterium]|jgi:predicted dehydrogenase|nr:Gfo/Idh/MocA family oxidoreductase [Planctomycetaceae bacterium]